MRFIIESIKIDVRLTCLYRNAWLTQHQCYIAGFRPSGVHIPADGKALSPLPLDIRKDNVIDPFNRYDPYNNRNRYNNAYNPYNNNAYSPYNNNAFNRYDPRYPNASRYPYDPRYNNQFNSYRNRPYGYVKDVKQEEKKESA